MAGDWLKIDVGLPEKAEVWEMAMTLGVEPDLVVGKLVKVWRWFDAHTENGNARSVTYALLDNVAGHQGFAEAMAFVGWLNVKGKDIGLPNFDRHNGKTAKNRALTAKRVAEHKAKKGNAEVTQSPLPREEKRRDIDQKQDQELGRSSTKTAFRGTRLPPGWSPDQEQADLAKTSHPNLDLRTELLKFRDYWGAKTGQQATKLDWSATFRNWLRKAQQDADRYKPRTVQSERPSARAAAINELLKDHRYAQTAEQQCLAHDDD